MNIKYRVKDFLGVKEISGDLEYGSVYRISGNNASGKSSTLTGIGICLSQKPNPYGLNQSQMGQYSHNGSHIASAELQIGEDFHIKYSVKGNIDAVCKKSYGPTEAIEVCAGLVDPLNWRKKEWGVLFRSVMIDYETFANALLDDWDAKPLTGDDAIDGQNPEARVASKIYNKVVDMGLATVLEEYREKLRNGKRNWENAASGDWGKNSYGDKKAMGWRPPGWNEAWSELSTEEVTAAVTQAEEHLVLTQSKLVVDDTMRSHHESTAAGLEEKEKELSDIHEERENDEIINELDEWLLGNTDGMGFAEMIRNTEQRIRDLNAKMQIGNRLKCPHCEGDVIEVNGKLVPHDEKAFKKIKAEIDEEEKTLAYHRKEKQEHEKEYAAKKDKLNKQTAIYDKDINEITAEISQCKQSARWLKENPVKKGGVGADEVAQAQTAVSEAKMQRYLVEKVRLAQAAATSCYQYQRIITSLDTGGVSSAFEEAGMGTIRKKLRELGQILDFDIEIDGGVLTYSGRVVQFCSESERWITRFAVQLAVGAYFGFPLVLVDRFDVLDEYNAKKYMGLFAQRNKMKGKPTSLAIIVAGTNRIEQETGDCHIADGKRANDKTQQETES